LYAFVANDPVRSVDPTGLRVVTILFYIDPGASYVTPVSSNILEHYHGRAMGPQKDKIAVRFLHRAAKPDENGPQYMKGVRAFFTYKKCIYQYGVNVQQEGKGGPPGFQGDAGGVGIGASRSRKAARDL